MTTRIPLVINSGSIQELQSGDSFNLGTGASLTSPTIATSMTLSYGTANGVAYLNGSKALTTGSTFVYDGANIGLSVSLNIGPQIQFTNTLRTYSHGLSGAPTGAYLIYDITNSTAVYDYLNTYGHRWWNGGAVSMALDQTGKLGVGTSTPLDKITAYSASGGNTIAAINAGSTISDYSQIFAQAGSYNTQFIQYGGGNAAISSSGISLVVGTTTAAPLVFQTNSTNRMSINSSGKVGINTDSQTHYLGVQGTNNTRAISVYTNNAVAGDYVSIGGQYAPSNTYCSSDVRFGVESEGSGTSYLAFATGAASPVERMRITSQGLVGIGLNNPTQMLDVNGYVKSTGYFIGLTGTGGFAALSTNEGTSANGAVVVRDGAASYNPSGIEFYAANAERMRINSSGNVGIGTSSPLTKAEVVGGKLQVSTGSGLGAAGRDALNLYTGAGARISFYDNSNSCTIGSVQNGGSSELTFSTNGTTERMRIDSQGNVGLGVTPSAWNTLKAFSVGSTGSSVSGNANGLYLTQSAYYNSGWKYSQSSTPAALYQQVANVHSWHVAPSGTADSAITFTQAMTLDASGTLLLGRTSVDASGNLLQVYATSGSKAGAIFTYGGVGSAAIWENSSNALVFGNDNNNGSTERMRIDSSGNVGIGTSSPASKLNVVGSPDATFNSQVIIGNSSATAQKLTFNPTISSGIAGLTDGGMAFYANGANTERMRIDSNGNVGIGTSSPDYKLDVFSNGSVGTVVDTARFYAYASGTAEARILFGSAANSITAAIGAQTFTGTSGALKFYTEGGGILSEKMRIDAAGYVGIGTTNPTIQLDVQAPSGILGQFLETTSGNSRRIRFSNSGTVNTIESTTASGSTNLAFTVDGTERMRITSGGTVSLYTTPSAWSSSGRAIQVPYGGFGEEVNGYTFIANNVYNSGSNAWKYMVSSLGGCIYMQNFGTHAWFTAPTGTADATATITQQMTLDSGGGLAIAGNLATSTGGISTADAAVDIGQSRTGDGNSYVDFHSQAGTDYDMRLIRASGANGVGYLLNNGTGGIRIDSVGAGPVAIWTSDTERMRVDSSGNLLVGTTSALRSAGTVSLVNETAGQLLFRNTAQAAGRYWYMGVESGNDVFFIYPDIAGGVYMTRGATSWTGNSDERLKTDLVPIESAIAKVSQLRSMTGRFKTDDEGVSRAFLIAQDVQAVLPEAVDVRDDEMGTLGVRYTEVIPLLVAAIKELKAELDATKAEVAALKGA